jgi:serine/threonine-protein kinase
MALLCVLKQWRYLDAAPDLVRRFGETGLNLLAAYHGLFWFSLLATYGLFIPNSWRRSAIIVTLIAACPLAVAVLGRADWPIPGRPFLFYLSVLGFWTGFGALLAVFGSHHLEVLRREAGEARELGQYRLTRRLGAGGMGEVYLAEHRLLRRPCAVKLIRPERVGDPRGLGLFEREVQATAGLTHPNTVEIYDYGRAEDGTFYYVMEYLSGLTLEEVVRRHGPLPPGRAVYLLRQVCDALREAHGAGLVHRDVKPGNVMVCTRGGIHDVAKLLDFGLVELRGSGKPGDDADWQGGIAGTPAYMAPEQAMGRNRADARSDLYSLGAVGFFLLTGHPPFVRASVRQVLAAHGVDPVIFPDRIDEGLPDDLQAVVLRCLNKDPADRYADAAHLEVALAACQCSGSWTREEAARWWGSMAGEGREMPDHSRQSAGASRTVSTAELGP